METPWPASVPAQVARLKAALLMAGLLAAGTLALGAQAGPADTLPRAVVGVVGSGDKLRLAIRPAGAAASKILSIGDEYDDGWTLQALTSSEATLAKAGKTLRIGLNPSGSLTPETSTTPATVVSVPLTGDRLARVTEAAERGYWNGRVLEGLTMAETQRRVFYTLELGAVGSRLYSQELEGVPFIDSMVEVLGEDGLIDLIDLVNRTDRTRNSIAIPDDPVVIDGVPLYRIPYEETFVRRLYGWRVTGG